MYIPATDNVVKGYEIANSLRFNDNDSAYLSRTPVSAGNRKTFTWSGWVKLGNLGINRILFSAGTTANYLRLFSDNSIGFGISGVANFQSTPVFRDPAAWYHVVWKVDTTQSSNRSRIYVNGVDVYSTNGWNQNDDTAFNATHIHEFGRDTETVNNYLDGYLADVHFIDGQALTPSSFGETGDYGEFKPIAYTGTYGTNGFYLDFKASGDLGNDVSGNGNDWTPTNLAATDQMIDTPTNNFCALNTVDARGTVTVSEGNLKADLAVNGNVTGTFAPTTGKWYWEVYLNDITNPYIGLQSVNTSGSASSGYSQDAVALNNAGDIYYDASSQSGAYEGSPAWTAADVLGVAYDADNNKMWWSLNGQWYSANASSESAINVSVVEAGNSAYDLSSQITHGVPFFGSSASNGIVTANFGQDSSFAGNKTAQGNTDDNGKGDFYYSPPSGYLALCSQNLPDATVVPSEHFAPLIYTGDGASSHEVNGLNFQPDLTWIKSRSNAYSHILVDAVRGVGANGYYNLYSNLTNAEDDGGNIDGLDSDGFTLDSNAGTNGNGATFVAWNWKANGAGVSNTDGSITSTVSANVDAGFSIVSYTGNGTAGATVGHGLSSALDLMLVKNRDGAFNWITYHSPIGATKYMFLNTTGAAATSTTVWNDTEPTASVFSLGTAGHGNNNGDNMIAYAFHSVDGYSKFGSYTGNGSTDGPFVHCGFRPAYVMIKRTDSSDNWRMYDSSRSPANADNKVLYPNLSNSEDASTDHFDWLSNGFKIRSTNNNTNGASYIIMAFANHPFKHANAA